MQQRERELQREILKLFKKRGILCDRRIPNVPGESDLVACIAGKFVAIELKVAGGHQEPAQIEYQKQVEQSGGIYLIVTSVEDMISWINWIVMLHTVGGTMPIHMTGGAK